MKKPSERVLNIATDAMAARDRIHKFIQKTPCIPSRGATTQGLIYKCENFQTTGSFKLRGATSKLTSVPVETPIITASSGNHGIACSHAAQESGHSISIVLPENVAKAKLSVIENNGAKPILFSNDCGLAERHARSRAEKDEYVYVSPYNDETVVAGQGTIALELIEQLPRMDRVYVSMGGGGLISGIGSVLKSFLPETEVVGVATSNSAALAASMEAGKVVDIEHHPTLADGCAGAMDHDSITFPLACEVVDRVISCSEEQIADALHYLAWTENMLVEGAAAVALAAYLADPEVREGEINVVLLCGANFDQSMLQPIVARVN